MRESCRASAQELGHLIMTAVTKLYSDLTLEGVEEKGNAAIELLGGLQWLSGMISSEPSSWAAFPNAAHQIQGCLDETSATALARKSYEDQLAIYREGERLRTQWDAIQNGTKNDPQLEKDWKRFLDTVRLMDGLK